MRETALSDSQKNVKAIFVWILGFGVLLGVAGSAFAGEIRDHRGPVRDHRADPKGPPGYTFCAKQGERCQFRGMTMDVAYGAYAQAPGGDAALNIPQFAYKHGISGGIDCNDGTFGDPSYGNVKACYIKDSRDHRVDPVGPPGYMFCARYGQRCQFRGPADVAFGPFDRPSKFAHKYGISGGIDCNDHTFGFREGDPFSGGFKNCYMKLIPSNVLDHRATPAIPESPKVPTGPATSGPQGSGPKRGGRAPVDSVQPSAKPDPSNIRDHR